MPRLRKNRGPSPRYCAICGGEIATMKPDSCANNTAHIPETEYDREPNARAFPDDWYGPNAHG